LFDAIMARTTTAPGAGFREETVGGVPGWWCEPAGARAQGVLLHLHGGWFGWGSAAGFRPLVSHLAVVTGLGAFVPAQLGAP
jgi:acetyl esterase/lipase